MNEGSIRSLWRVSWPLMLGFLSWVGMTFIDRMFLGMFSAGTLNAAVNAGAYAMALTFGMDQLTRITVVFVSRRNGAGKTEQLGEITWQGIWASLFSIAFFVPLSLFGSSFLFGVSEHSLLCREYFRWFVLLGPLAGIQAALSSYFVGQGRMGVVGAAVLFGNLINFVLDPLLIFGYGVVPSMGMVGAFVATALGTLGQILFLLALFLRNYERFTFGTGDWSLKLPLLVRIIRLGTPPAAFLLFEMVGAGIFYSMLAGVSQEYLLVAGIHQSLFILLIFFGGGLEHAGQTLAGNLIGAGKVEELPRLLRSGFILHLFYAAFLSIALWLVGEWTVELFLNEPGGSDLAIFSAESLEWVRSTAWLGLGWLIIRLSLETSSWLLNGVLRAAGDTLFPMVMGVVNIGVGLLLPTYFLLVKGSGSMQIAFYIWVFYGACALIYSGLRFTLGGWRVHLKTQAV